MTEILSLFPERYLYLIIIFAGIRSAKRGGEETNIEGVPDSSQFLSRAIHRLYERLPY